MPCVSLRKILQKAYEYDSVRAVKDWLRPAKHALFGKNDIYRWIDQITRDGGPDRIKTVFDVGAAAGDKTLLFLRSFPQATVYCFEPLRCSFDRLCKRTARYSDRLRLFNAGFYKQAGKQLLKVMSYNDASSLLPLQGLENGQIVETGEEEIELYTMDKFVTEHEIEKIDLVKIDVEGVEQEVIEGGLSTFASKIDNVIIEISPLRKGPHSDSHIRVFECLHKAGFSFIGCDVDYFFSKDPGVLAIYFHRGDE